MKKFEILQELSNWMEEFIQKWIKNYHNVTKRHILPKCDTQTWNEQMLLEE